MSFFQKFKQQLPKESQTESRGGGQYCKEAIATLYRPETIDVSTVKVMGEEGEPTSPFSLPIKEKEEGKKVLEQIYKLEEPVEDVKAEPITTAGQDEFFDLFSKEFSEFLKLGNGFSPYLASFKLLEPISILGLSAQAEKSLVDNGKTTLGDLAEMRKGSFKFLKGIGQGHIDEICQKTVEYLKGESLFFTEWVDFEALIRTTLSRLSSIKAHVLLKKYKLESLIPISPAEMVEVKHMTKEKVEEEQQEVIDLLKESRQAKQVRDSVKKIAEVYLIPWVESRCRFASKEELEERLDRVSRKGEKSRPFRKLLSEIFFEGEPLFQPFLKSVGGNLYFDSDKVVKTYRLVLKTALSYFYKPHSAYALEELSAFVERELAQKWIDLQEGFVRKILIYTPEFRVRKETNGKIMVMRW